jgi:predicted small metal-binding protein
MFRDCANQALMHRVVHLHYIRDYRVCAKWVSSNLHQPAIEEIMMTTFAYACADYPGMENCPGKVQAKTESELWELIETHARIAHGEDPSAWSAEDRAAIRQLINTTE